jgi:glycosyltransferase involved in cell wall biosynthesis
MIDTLAVGGAETLLVGIINGLDGYEHHIMTLNGPGVLLQQIKVQHKHINLDIHSYRKVFARSGQVRSYIKENKIDIVHSHLYMSNLMARLGTPKRVPLINSIHAISSLAAYKVNKMTLYLEKWSYRKRHIIIAVSKAVLDDFDEWVGLKGKSHVLYNFIDDKFFQPAGTYSYKNGIPLQLVAVGNLRYQKNYPYLMEAFRNVPAGVHLDIYGEGPMREELQAKIDEYKLPVTLKGVHHNMQELLPQYDAFVMSSFYEGQPVSLLEAMACGLPALLADIPVLREVGEKEAVYFSIKEPASFVKAVQEVIDGKYPLEKFVQAGYEKVNRFARKAHYMQQLDTIYKTILSD